MAKKLGTHMKYYNLHREFFPVNILKLDRDASKLDLSDKTNFNVSPKFLESLETQARNVFLSTRTRIYSLQQLLALCHLNRWMLMFCYV